MTTMLEAIDTQVVAMTGCIAMARNTNDAQHARVSALSMAFMHACNAAIMANRSSAKDVIAKYGFRLDDYKHEVKQCIDRVMSGVMLNSSLAQLRDWKDE